MIQKVSLDLRHLWRTHGIVDCRGARGISEPRKFTAVFAAESFEVAAKLAPGVLVVHCERLGWQTNKHFKDWDGCRVQTLEAAGSIYGVSA